MSEWHAVKACLKEAKSLDIPNVNEQFYVVYSSDKSNILNFVRSTCIKRGTGNTTYLFNIGRIYFTLDGLSCILIQLIL